jgi:hypothetical protein
MAVLQAAISITTNSNISSKAINIQRIQSGISSFLTLTSNSIKLQYSKTSLSVNSTATVNSKKVSYLKTNILSTSQAALINTKSYSTAKSNIKCSSILNCYYYDRDIQVDLKSYIPPFLLKSKVFREILKVQGNEITKNNALLQDILAQYFVDTATWGLKLWEKELGIVTNTSLTYEKRREKIKFRLQLKNETVTKKFFKSVMDKYYTCNIDEDFINSKIAITILGKRGVPEDINEMLSDADELIPAHLIYEFIYTYLPWSELDESSLTWNQIDTYTWDGLLTSFLT